jgi:hypothetical protein
LQSLVCQLTFSSGLQRGIKINNLLYFIQWTLNKLNAFSYNNCRFPCKDSLFFYINWDIR